MAEVAKTALRPRLLGIVADDLTGAADSAVPFAAAGMPVFLLRGPNAPDPWTDRPAVLTIATGVRALDDAAAAEKTAVAVKELLARGCDRIYVKVDSTMRGSVAGQLRGALAAWSTVHPDPVAVLCPAFCEQGRTVVAGRVLVEGVPIEAGAAGRDPVSPVRESRLDLLVPGGVTLGPGLRATPEPGQVRPILLADAASEADLDALATVIDGLGASAIGAGSAGLAAALARRWATDAPNPATSVINQTGRLLVAVSSLHPTATAAVNRLRTDQELPFDVLTTPADRAGDAAQVAAEFGDNVAKVLLQSEYDALILVGGDGAAAALDRLGVQTIVLHSALLPGVPLGTVLGGTADGLRVVTRSGGFGDDAGLLDLVRLLQTAP
jgi:uncharacterized protein YgbK (DUF1537 family)